MPSPTIVTIRNLRGVGILGDCTPSAFGHVFKRHNLIYGFNGSGKTTLSRLIDSLGDRGVSAKLESGAHFCFELSDGSHPDSSASISAASRFIAVFNEDYVERSLAWTEGTAEPIIYVGEEQAETVKELGLLESRERDEAAADTIAGAELSATERELSNLARDAARLIAEEIGLARSYNATTLKNDFDAASYGSEHKLPEEVRVRLRQTINQTNLPANLNVELESARFTPALEMTQRCLRTSLAKLTIENLDRRQDALDWVREGLDLHSSEQDCLFCGNAISDGRITDLSAALSSGFEQLRNACGEAKAALDAFRGHCRANRDLLGDIGEALPAHASAIGIARSTLAHIFSEGELAASKLTDDVAKKLVRPEQQFAECAFDSKQWEASLEDATLALRQALSANNQDLDDFEVQKVNARSKLKSHHLADYEGAYRDTVGRVARQSAGYQTSTAALRRTRREIGLAKSKLRTHGPATSKINEILRGYLGHSEIQLNASEEGYQLLRRGSADPKPLSEGEKTAIAFSHFLATLHSEGRRPQDFIVVLDDPISSLDTRAMTHAVALIKQRFEEPLQLFVLTHNLDFMREMKKWLDPKRKKGLAEFLFIRTTNGKDGRSSEVVKLPALIREYESEYHYLYSLTKQLADDPQASESYAYLMPNAIRKVIEIFLAFKMPGNDGLGSKIKKLVLDYPLLNGPAVGAMERLAALESHSESIGDTTTFSAYTLEQISDAAKCLMGIIETLDSDHKKAMDKLCS